jgi:RNA polymerase sigma-70 factor, ECF subfamily
MSATARRATPGSRVEIADVNGEPALIVRAGGEVRLVLSISVEEGRVCTIRVIRNPDKLLDLNRALHAMEREPGSEN